MLTRWLTRLESIHRATTREELEAVYRFRYTVYVEEYGRELGRDTQDREWVHDADDEKPYSTILYSGSVDDMTGSVRLRHWRPGEVPQAEAEALSMHLFPDIDQRRVAEIGRFMIRRSLRGRLLLASFARAAYDQLAGEERSDLTFCYCSPGLVRYYRKLGARPFGGVLVPTVDGMMVPLVSVMSDHAYYRRMGSPLAPLVRRHFGPGKRPPVDATPYLRLFESDSHLELEPEKVWEELHEAVVEQRTAAAKLLESLSPELIRRMSKGGFLMDVPEGTLVTRQGFSEQEMYVVLDGLFEVLDDDRRLCVMSRGELFGEVAFFRKSGRRSASVRALGDGRVMVLRGRSLEKMIADEPRLAAELLLAIGGILSERLTSQSAATSEG